MRKTFCAALKAPDSRRSSATRSTKAAAGTTSPYTNGLSFTLNTVMSTEYSVVATTGEIRENTEECCVPLPTLCRAGRSVITLRQIEDHAPLREIGEHRGNGPARQRVECGAVDNRFVRQVLAAGAVLLLVILGREPQTQTNAVAVGFDFVQRV